MPQGLLHVEVKPKSYRTKYINIGRFNLSNSDVLAAYPCTVGSRMAKGE